MKKIVSLVLVALIAVSCVMGLASCGGSGNTDSKAEVKELHMATNAAFEPYEFYKDKKIVGIDPEMAQAICDKLGYKLVIDDMDFDAIITAVTTGKADFGMAGMTVTDERKKKVDFTDSYTTTTQVIIVNEKDNKVKSADDLETATIGVQRGTTGDVYVSDLEKAKIERFNTGPDAVLALTKGKVDAVVIDGQPAKAFVKKNKGTKILSDPFAEEDYAICLAKDSELTAEFNKALKELKKDGTLDKINAKYIKE